MFCMTFNAISFVTGGSRLSRSNMVSSALTSSSEPEWDTLGALLRGGMMKGVLLVAALRKE